MAPEAVLSSREVVRLEARPWPLPQKLVLRPVVAAGAITLYFANSMMAAEGGLGFAFGMFVVLLVVFTPTLLGGVVQKSLRTSLALDDGGMRLALRGTRAHWPYSILGSAKVRLSSFGTDALVISDRTDRVVVEIPLLNPAAAASAHEVVRRFEELHASALASTPAERDELVRRGLALDEWCLALDELARLPEHPGFRERFLDRNELAEILAAPGARPEQRAAAAYVMLRSDEPHRETALSLLGPASPPLVLALAERAASELPVPARAREDARDYLDQDDRQALARS
jgi:hypothetical protein